MGQYRLLGVEGSTRVAYYFCCATCFRSWCADGRYDSITDFHPGRTLADMCGQSGDLGLLRRYERDKGFRDSADRIAEGLMLVGDTPIDCMRSAAYLEREREEGAVEK